MSVKEFLQQRAVNIQLAALHAGELVRLAGKAPYLRLPDQPRFAVPDVGRRACGRQDRGSRHILFR